VLFGFVPTPPDGAVVSVRDLVAEPALLGRSRVPVEWYRHPRFGWSGVRSVGARAAPR